LRGAVCPDRGDAFAASETGAFVATCPDATGRRDGVFRQAGLAVYSGKGAELAIIADGEGKLDDLRR
jgi:hypothetical protein